LLVFAGCGLDLDPPRPIIHARFDPDEKVIPMPTDVLRDAELGRLDVPTDDADLTAAEKDFFGFLNTLDGWSSAMSATVEFTAPIAPETLNADSLQVWKWGDVPTRVTDVTVTLDEAHSKVTLDAPRYGWDRGATYAVLLVGSSGDPKDVELPGVRGPLGEKVECDAAFYFLRQVQKLDTERNLTAFPGDTRKERLDNAEKLEEIRLSLEPMFEFFAAQKGFKVPRNDVAALWKFTVTTRTELAMDKPSQRMPLPIDLLIDPATGRMELPVAPWDSPTAVEAKERLADLTGFGISPNLMFELTGPVDLSSVTASAIELWEMSEPPVRVPADPVVMDDKQHMFLKLKTQSPILKEQTRYAVVVRDSVKDASGEPLIAMPVGHFLRSTAQVFDGSKSQVKAIADVDALRLEGVRQELGPLFDAIGRDGVLAAWPFTTMPILQPLKETVTLAEKHHVSPEPTVHFSSTPLAMTNEFALAFMSYSEVKTVVRGTIPSPQFLDPILRRWRENDAYAVENVHFTMTIPRSARADKPLPVVIFGHAIVTEGRFLMAIGDSLARAGYAGISIDFPYHGFRTYCSNTGPISVVNPTTGEQSMMEPCTRGTTCNELGKCVDDKGQYKDSYNTRWPAVQMPVASGAKFIEIENIGNTRDHFRQALVDLGALSRSLRTADWKKAIGYSLKTDKLAYVGQS
jgi:hypothetical protein